MTYLMGVGAPAWTGTGLPPKRLACGVRPSSGAAGVERVAVFSLGVDPADVATPEDGLTPAAEGPVLAQRWGAERACIGKHGRCIVSFAPRIFPGQEGR